MYSRQMRVKWVTTKFNSGWFATHMQTRTKCLTATQHLRVQILGTLYQWVWAGNKAMFVPIFLIRPVGKTFCFSLFFANVKFIYLFLYTHKTISKLTLEDRRWFAWWRQYCPALSSCTQLCVSPTVVPAPLLQSSFPVHIIT